MLTLLRIQNFALIDNLELNFRTGLNVLTGETGAGKSIILDAIDLVFGGRINSRFLRQGNSQGSIEVTFKISLEVEQWLLAEKIEPINEGYVICTKDFALTGTTLKSNSRVNGVLVNKQLLKTLREHLIEITAQGQTVQLTDKALQRELLDLYGGKQISTLRLNVAEAYLRYKSVQKELNDYLNFQKERLQRLDLVQFQLEELKSAQLSRTDELEFLEQESERLSHVVDLQKLGYGTYQLLYQNDQDQLTVTDLLGQVLPMLKEMSAYDPALLPLEEMINSALNQVVEAGNQINSYSDRLESDPTLLEEIEERIRLLKRLSRKYGPTLADVLGKFEELENEFQFLTTNVKSQTDLEKSLQAEFTILEMHCQQLFQIRKKVATKLEKDLVKELKPLAMDRVVFSCNFNSCPPTSLGSEEVEFYFSPNAGEKMQPLCLIASGGEMSRFLLALKSCFANYQNNSYTLIFDEIDSGVSGKVAQEISLKLQKLSQKNQVLCVTHQPLIAAMADAHFQVTKVTVEEDTQLRTVIRVNELTTHETRINELAQLAGGYSAQDALDFADSLLKKKFKS